MTLEEIQKVTKEPAPNSFTPRWLHLGILPTFELSDGLKTI